MSVKGLEVKNKWDTVYVKENNVHVPYLIVEHDYDSSGVMLLRKNCCDVSYEINIENFVQRNSIRVWNDNFANTIQQDLHDHICTDEVFRSYNRKVHYLPSTIVRKMPLEHKKNGASWFYDFDPDRYRVYYVDPQGQSNDCLALVDSSGIYISPRPVFCLPHNLAVNDAGQVLATRLPSISGSDEKRGYCTQPFVYQYSVTDYGGNYGLNVKEKLVSASGERLIRSFVATSGQTYSIDTSFVWGEGLVGDFQLVLELGEGLGRRIIQFSRENVTISISGVDTDFGVQHNPFTYSYSFDDGAAGSYSYRVTESLNMESESRTLRSFIGSAGLQYTANPIAVWQENRYGNFELVINVDGPNDSTATRTIQFSRMKQQLVISGEDVDMGLCLQPVQYQYMLSDGNTDYPISYDVTEKVCVGNEEIILRSFTAATEQPYTADTSSAWPNIKGKAKLVIEARDDILGENVLRTIEFVRAKAPVTISGNDEDYGVCAAPFAYQYTIEDGEDQSSSYTVSEKVVTDSGTHELRSFAAFCGDELSADISPIWLEVYGNLALVIEVQDDILNETVSRTIQFSRDASRIEVRRSFETDQPVSKFMILTEPRELPAGAELKFYVTNTPFDGLNVWQSTEVNTPVCEFGYPITHVKKPGFGYRFTLTPGEDETYLKRIIVKYL